MSIRSDVTRRGLIGGAASLASYCAFAQSVTLQIGGGLGQFDGALGGAGWWLPGSAVDMDFANGRYYGGTLANLLSCTRAQTVSSYATNADGSLTAFAANVPRIGIGTGLLVEEARTNSFLWSQDYTNAAWTKSGTAAITAAATQAPDGTTTGNLFTSSGAFSFFSPTTAINVVASTTYVWSVYAKAGSGNVLTLVNEGTNLVDGAFTLSGAGSSTQSGSGFTNIAATIVALANGWYRCILTFTVPASGVTTMIPKTWMGIYNATSTAGQTIYTWGEQFELGSFPTSYIPTTTAAATRNADNVTATGALLAAYKSAAVTQYAKTSSIGGISSNRLGASFDSVGGATPTYAASATSVGVFNRSSATTTTIGASGNLITGIVNSVGSFSGAGNSIVANGGTEATSINVMPSVTTPYIGSDQASGGFLNGYLRRLSIWVSQLPSPTRIQLSNQ